MCVVLVCLALTLGCGVEEISAPEADVDEAAPIAERELAGAVCENSEPLRQVLWGDLHVHTGISMDAYMFGTRLRPTDAYRFARGDEVTIGPFGDGSPARPIRIERPLDFAAVTDHAANFGGVSLCSTPGSAVYDSEFCTSYREPFDVSGGGDVGGDLREVVRAIQDRAGEALASFEICGENDELCHEAALDVWQETQDAAAEFDDDAPACSFTTFVAYEWTYTPDLTKIHRNVIFRNATVPEMPIDSATQPSAIGLWRDLREQCIDAGTGCDVLAIPHNPNLSNGHIFALEYGDAQSVQEQAEVARLRAAMEPIVEMSQMKGDSECRNGMWNVLGATDELCDFEKIRPVETPDCEDGTGQGALGGDGCISRRDFVRYALVEGLIEAERLGVNPFPFGFIAATDGHDGLPGPVEEWRQDLLLGRAGPGPGRNLGGLAAVWAEENSRESIFEALRRKETYGTSGPRISVRFFGGYDYPAGLCGDAELVRKGYDGGVPMGGELEPGANGAAPTFVVSALRDPGTAAHPGGLLQRAQIVKGWADDEGRIHQRVIDVAGGRNDAAVDPATCAPTGAGAESLCGVWTDPDFDPARRAVYYARVVENPSCRQTGWACAAEDPPAWCQMPGLETTIQERAWTSPIWYTP
jgi:hypothetical protein